MSLKKQKTNNMAISFLLINNINNWIFFLQQK